MLDTTPVHAAPDADLEALRERTRALCARFPDAYWRETDRDRRYPQEFVDTLTGAGLLAVLIPAEYGGGGMGVTAGSVVMEEINRSGGHSAACHAQMYTMGALLRHGSDRLKDAYLPLIAAGELRLQAFSITETTAGSDTTAIDTTATRDGDGYVLTGHKNWTSRIAESDLALVLARTSEKGADRTRGLTLFLVDLRRVRAEQPEALEVVPVRTMFNYATNQVFYRGVRVPADHVVGEVDAGFRYVIDGWNAERILLAAEAIGDGYWFVDRAVGYATRREVFGRPIGANQGVQFPLADAYMRVRAADLMRWEAARLFDAGHPCGAEANMAKHLASEASWAAANAALDTHGGNGFVDEYDVERKFRETRMYQVAPVNNNMIKSFVATKVLGLPRSY
ncbi:acyl-CoA dehydrogenase family protein [Geodermatophilus sp. DSM 44513]|uniref:acyl-CoA dehydrogenase family protein n=1 Tax=Geodermatophilus sp. DSM 44513 TaxID=1528104 RepID=UPI0012899806|nr:acyl-CoA dehydrogenase family protein [Geodermatophilus sp. DSM 44513]WNV77112.1 acyl-CoA dehydrogenase family protein [Geodermatophilus sp. DSM 44513]